MAYLVLPFIGDGYVGIREAWRIVHTDQTEAYWSCVDSLVHLFGAGGQRLRFPDVDNYCRAQRPATLSYADAKAEWERRYPR